MLMEGVGTFDNAALGIPTPLTCEKKNIWAAQRGEGLCVRAQQIYLVRSRGHHKDARVSYRRGSSERREAVRAPAHRVIPIWWLSGESHRITPCLRRKALIACELP